MEDYYGYDDEEDYYPEQSEPDSKMMDYHPYSKGRNPMHSRGSDSQILSFLKQGYDQGQQETDFYNKVFCWLQRELEKLGKGVILALVPGHKEDPNPDGLAHKIARKLRDKCREQNKPVPFQDQLLLIRTRTVPKSASSQGARSRDTHRGTIKVGPNSPDCSGQVVVILDDIWTSGSTLQVCAAVVREKYPSVKKVELFAVGRTISWNPTDDF